MNTQGRWLGIWIEIFDFLPLRKRERYGFTIYKISRQKSAIEIGKLHFMFVWEKETMQYIVLFLWVREVIVETRQNLNLSICLFYISWGVFECEWISLECLVKGERLLWFSYRQNNQIWRSRWWLRKMWTSISVALIIWS